MRKTALFYFLTIACCCTVYGQDTNKILGYSQYIDKVLDNNPMAMKAQLFDDVGDAEVLKAKGSFDPSLNFSHTLKNIEETEYYRFYDIESSVSLPIGADIIVGYRYGKGDYINPIDFTSNNGLFRIGVEVDILQGLLVNDANIARDQSYYLQDYYHNRKLGDLNELLFTASLAYLEWQTYYENGDVLQENLELSFEYHRITKVSFENGEKTAIDTLESFIQVQDAQVLIQENQLLLADAFQKVSFYLTEDTDSLEFLPQNLPTQIETNDFSQNVPFDSIPTLQMKESKIQIAELDARLKKEKLKPKLKAKAFPLLVARDNFVPNYQTDNYNYGIDFSYPIPNRTARGNYQLSKLKLQQNVLDLQNARNEYAYQIRLNMITQQNIERQYALVSQNVENYQSLLDAEISKLKFGESSIFLVNKRQEKYIVGRIKMVQLLYKLEKSKLYYNYLLNTW